MPSHIFTRVGYWDELIESNGASAQAAKQSKDFDEQMHAMDYMVYAYLQLGAGRQGAVGDARKYTGITGFNRRMC